MKPAVHDGVHKDGKEPKGYRIRERTTPHRYTVGRLVVVPARPGEAAPEAERVKS